MFYIYGKRTEPIWNTDTHEFMGPDKRFAALDKNGIRVTKIADAYGFETKEEAQRVIDKNKTKPGVILEIRSR